MITRSMGQVVVELTQGHRTHGGRGWSAGYDQVQTAVSNGRPVLHSLASQFGPARLPGQWPCDLIDLRLSFTMIMMLSVQ